MVENHVSPTSRWEEEGQMVENHVSSLYGCQVESHNILEVKTLTNYMSKASKSTTATKSTNYHLKVHKPPPQSPQTTTSKSTNHHLYLD